MTNRYHGLAAPAGSRSPALDIDAFVGIHWEKRPAMFHAVVPMAFLSSTDTFRATLQAVRAFNDHGRAPIRFYEGDGLRQSNLLDWLPQPDDGSFDAYAHRIEPGLGGRGFSLIVNNLQKYDFAYWCRLRRVLRPLYERVGVPAETADADLFVGTGTRTPFGMHKDRASNFCLVLEGRKRFLLWPYEVFRDHPALVHTTHYEGFRDGAIVLEGGPGDVLYWPSSYWHVAESDGSLSVTSNVALYLHRPGHQAVAREMALEIADRRGATDPPATYPLAAGLLPDEIAKAVVAAEEAATTIGRRVRAAWLARASADGFEVVPDPIPDCVLTIDEMVQSDVEFPITFVDDHDTWLCAAHGISFEGRSTPAIRAVVERLAAGTPMAVTDVADPAADPRGAFQVLFFLERLLSIRAVRKCQDAASGDSAPSSAV
jgi:50S ribosomal protein L16 3-hydroxylase